jgi:hypothetical protein
MPGLFDCDGNNTRVQLRLKIVLEYYLKYYQSCTAEKREIFNRLAEAAYSLVPPLSK